MANNGTFKLVTRRVIAWVFGGIAVCSLAFTLVWGVLHQIGEYVTMAGTALGMIVTALIAFYFKDAKDQ